MKFYIKKPHHLHRRYGSTTYWNVSSSNSSGTKKHSGEIDAVIKACGLRSISDFQLLTLERRKSVIQEVMRSLDVRPRQLSRVTGMNYETIRNIAKKLPWKQAPIPRCPWLWNGKPTETAPRNQGRLANLRKRQDFAPCANFVASIMPCRNNSGKISPKFMESGKSRCTFASSIRQNKFWETQTDN